jgi:tetrahydromethanopterin S-methyltransferase subunit D
LIGRVLGTGPFKKGLPTVDTLFGIRNESHKFSSASVAAVLGLIFISIFFVNSTISSCFSIASTTIWFGKKTFGRMDSTLCRLV